VLAVRPEGQLAGGVERRHREGRETVQLHGITLRVLR
jgi:hypothetical protein